MEKYQEGLGECSSHIRFEVRDDCKLDSGMTYDVGIRSLRKLLWIYIVLFA
jgi:hypothetical protein